jgi:serine/threonine-protein kinase RsbW
MSAKAAIQVRNDFEELERLSEFLSSFWEYNQLQQEELLDLNLALEEAFANVVMHGFEDEAEHQIDIEVSIDHNTVRLTVEDGGVPFNPLSAADVDVTAPLEIRSIGGLGIFMIRKLTDKVEYTREGNRNRLLMEKRISGGTYERQ